MDTEFTEIFKDFSLLSDEKPMVGEIISFNGCLYSVSKVLKKRVWHYDSADCPVEGLNPDLSEDQGWMRFTVLGRKISD